MRSPIIAVIVGLSVAPAVAGNEAPAKVGIQDARSLIGKTLDEDTQYAAGSGTERVSVGDWTYGFDYDDAGLLRTARTSDRRNEKSLLSTGEIYHRRCDRTSKTVRFALAGDERFPLKGTVAKGRRADGWVYYAEGVTFALAPTKIRMEFSENDGALHLALDRARMMQTKQLALCPTAAAPVRTGGRCAIFSLAGFARAFDFVCDAK